MWGDLAPFETEYLMAEEEKAIPAERKKELEKLLKAVESGRLDSSIVKRYLEEGTALLGDDSPMMLDVRRRANLERVLGRDPGNLRIHTGERARGAAEAMDARAFAVGERDIFLSSDIANRLDTKEGFAVLAHEATHSLQEQAPVAFSRSGPATDEMERQARSVEERVLAQDSPGVTANLKEGPGEEGRKAEEGFDPAKLMDSLSDYDRERLERMVYDIIQRRTRFNADRMGAPNAAD